MLSRLFFIALLAQLWGCQKNEVPIPAYLHIQPFSFSASASQGNATEDITNGQVFVNGRFVGDYEFPVTFPVTTLGPADITVSPSIKENGVSNPRRVYRLYAPFEQSINLVAQQIDTLQPTTTYRSNVEFEWIEDFDDNAISVSKGSNNQISDSLRTYPFTDPAALPGMGKGFTAGVIFPTNSNGLAWEVVSNQSFDVPKGGRDVYMEMDLLSDIAITVGIIYETPVSFVQTEVVTFFQTDGQYKKLYLNLVSETSPLPQNTQVRIFIGGRNFLGDVTQPRVFIDNIKLAYLN